MSILALVRSYGDSLAGALATTGGDPEDQLKPPVRQLISQFGREVQGLQARAATEYRLAESLGVPGLRPDIGVEVDNRPMGFVELKSVAKGADPTKFKSAHDKEQWQKLKDVPNLIYTNGVDWNLYQLGQLKASAKLPASVVAEGGTVLDSAVANQLEQLLTLFYTVKVIAPESPKQLASVLAPLCRLLRDSVLAAVQLPESALAKQAKDWRTLLFADADDHEFADAYAQTVTYGLLLARMEDDAPMDRQQAYRRLEHGHGLLARALRTLTDDEVEAAIAVPLRLLEEQINAVQPARVRRRGRGRDPWLYFYEQFLAEYDPKLRNNRGVYYTPVEVVDAQVRMVQDLLKTDLGLANDLLDPSVIILDPAVGTGTYPLAVLDIALLPRAEKYGAGAVAADATSLASRLFGFEIMVGPYAVAHMRVSATLNGFGGELPKDGASIYLGDTLESPFSKKQAQMGSFYERLTQEHERVQAVKRDTRVMVCLGNPPYDRQQLDPNDTQARRKGGWVRHEPRSDVGLSKFQKADVRGKPLLEDFLEPARAAGKGGHLKNIYNDYVYFWRWAMWKVLEQSDDPGIVTFITAASFLRGPGFVGVREHMRRAFDEIWILDLEGDNLGARKTENVFNIQTPVCITVGIRRGAPAPLEPAKVWYRVVEGSRDEKLKFLEGVQGVRGVEWRKCLAGWQAPMLPIGAGDYGSWPALIDVFPWQLSGSQFKRTWPISASSAPLPKRWAALLNSQDLRAAFVETRDRKVDRSYPSVTETALIHRPLQAEPKDAPHAPIARYAFRSFDRQWILRDNRLADFIRPTFWAGHSDKQSYLVTLITCVLGCGAAAVASGHIPDLNSFNNRASHAIPLWRNATATDPNLPAGLLVAISPLVGPTTPEDLFAYAYAILSNPGYVEKFSQELTIPGGPALPLTKDPELFRQAVALGSDLLCWHTYGERYRPNGKFELSGTARWRAGIPAREDAYPEKYEYLPETQEIALGQGRVGPVDPAVFSYSVSGLQVVRSWLNYRMKGGAGKASSPLDQIRDTVWPAEFNVELLELLWVLEHTVAVRAQLDALLEDVLGGLLFNASELPQPTDGEREAPKVAGRQATLI